MRRKRNLILSIVTVVLTMFIFAFGVYAALSTSFSISNNITFSPDFIAVDIVGRVSGYEGEEDTQTQIANYVYDKYDESSQENEPPANWSDPKLQTLTFKDASTPIVFEFTITSKTSDSFNVYIVEDIENDNGEYITNTISHTETAPLSFTQKGQEQKVTMTVRVNDANKKFDKIYNNFSVHIVPVL